MRYLCLLALVGLSACTSVGPRTISSDQLDYSAALSSAEQEQLLHNIVRMRYMESPVFLKVSSLINQYELEGSLALRAGFDDNEVGGNSQNLGAAGRWADKPTITFSPLSGKVFAESLLTPIRPEALFGLLQAGWPVDILFRLCVRSINGVDNEAAAPSWRRQAEPEFTELMAILKRLRRARVIALRRDDTPTGPLVYVYLLDRPGRGVTSDRLRLLELLGLDPGASEFLLTYGPAPTEGNEIAVLTESVFEILGDLAWRIDVPESHANDGRTGPTFASSTQPDALMRVRYSVTEPPDALVKIRERDHWFYIDDRDLSSKRTFAILRILMGLMESGDAARAPLVTISN